MTALDWGIVALYFVASAAIGIGFSARASRSLEHFFVGGRSLPWWLVGTSMVATTFAADTPLAVTELVARYGVAGNWLWWNMVMSGILTVFFYARLWHRAGVITDAQMTELRYGGRPAALLRGFRAAYLAFLPATGAVWMPTITLATYLGVNWWAAWYPGAEPGGGGYVAQRIFAARSERDGQLATLWFNVAHYAVRPWPWILVALASTILYPGLEDPKQGYVMAMVDLLPPGLFGLMIAAFTAAYMSTISTQLNWGASYLVNDLYVRFVNPRADERRLVMMARLATLALMIASLTVTRFMTSIEGAWRFLLAVGAGTGLVLILRWYWWRINAWSEISAMIASLILSLVLWNGVGLDAADPTEWSYIMLATVGGSTVVWLAVTYLTGPEDSEVPQAFYRRVRPGGRGWAPVSSTLGLGDEPMDGGPLNWTNWVAGVVSVYASLFGVGKLIFGEELPALLLLAVAVACFAWLARNLRSTEGG